MKSVPIDVIPALGAMSGSTTTYTSASLIYGMQGYSVGILVTAASSGVTGSFKLQASNDRKSLNPNLPASNVVNWVDVTSASLSVNVPSGSSSYVMINKAGVYWDWMRLVYVGTSGSGSFVAKAVAKGPA